MPNTDFTNTPAANTSQKRAPNHQKPP
ncbi:hypothetical protein A2U01_0100212, partial [Trifolium medium]|nr:hypothetical protein [Trifolium medium]